MIYSIILLRLGLIIAVNSLKIISFKCTNGYPNCVLLASITQNSNDINISTDIKYPYNWVTRSFYEKHLSSINCINHTIEVPFEVPKDNYYSHKTYNSKILKGYFKISSNNELNYTFLNFNYVDIGYYDRGQIILGLGYKISKYYDNFLQSFYNEKIIDYLAFSFTNNNNNRFIHLGGIPKEFSNNKRYTECNVLGNNRGFWDCSLTKILINNNTYDVHGEVSFDNRNKYIFVPRAFNEYLMNTYFKDGIESNQCWRSIFVYCVEMYYVRLPNIIIVIEDSEYLMIPQELFQDDFKDKGKAYKFMIKDNFEDSWIFGKPLLDKYNTLFDYQKNKIFFFTVEELNIKHNINKKIIFGIVLILGLFGLIFIVYIKKSINV